MAISKMLAAAGVMLAALGVSAADAQPVMHQRTVVTTHRTTTVTHHGLGWHKPRCHTEWRHHHRVRVCR